jgi:hypothetical protein
MIWLRERQKLNQLVAAIKGETSSYRLATDLVRSRAQGKPFDPERATLFGMFQGSQPATYQTSRHSTTLVSALSAVQGSLILQPIGAW